MNNTFDYVDDFIDSNFFQTNRSLLIHWLPGNQSMSRLEFKRSLEVILNTVTATQSEFVLIDAFDYNYPIVSNETARLLRYSLVRHSSVNQYGLVNSQFKCGQIAINEIVKQLDDLPVNLVLFSNRCDGYKWFLSHKLC
jgi:hypothetical protein